MFPTVSNSINKNCTTKLKLFFISTWKSCKILPGTTQQDKLTEL